MIYGTTNRDNISVIFLLSLHPIPVLPLLASFISSLSFSFVPYFSSFSSLCVCRHFWKQTFPLYMYLMDLSPRHRLYLRLCLCLRVRFCLGLIVYLRGFCVFWVFVAALLFASFCNHLFFLRAFLFFKMFLSIFA